VSNILFHVVPIRHREKFLNLLTNFKKDQLKLDINSEVGRRRVA
jgi:hypothetical protein